ncbi:MAG: exonuclease SbcCD subunit D [Actinomycetota bacterium]
MKLLHTSDWHVGKAIRGHSRAGEHRAVLAEIVSVARAEEVDLSLVVGDLFDTAAPTAESEALVYDALLDLAEVAPVVVVAGNHDNPRRLDAVARPLQLGRITMAAALRRPDDGGVLRLSAGGVPVNVALLPFQSQRAIIRAADLMDSAAFRNVQTYAERIRAVMAALATGFDGDSVNLLAAHLFVTGAKAGGGERSAHLADEYGVTIPDLPTTANYVALGHLHRPQQLPAPMAVHYCGSPLALDFGEEAQIKQINLATCEPGLPAKVTAVPLRSGRSLVTLVGTLDDVRAQARELGAFPGSGSGGAGEEAVANGGDAGVPWIRVRLTEQARAGLADEVRAAIGPAVVDVRIESRVLGDQRAQVRARRDGLSPTELFAEYLTEREVNDPRLVAAFTALHDEHVTPEVADGAEPAEPERTDPSSAAESADAEQLSMGL